MPGDSEEEDSDHSSDSEDSFILKPGMDLYLDEK